MIQIKSSTTSLICTLPPCTLSCQICQLWPVFTSPEPCWSHLVIYTVQYLPPHPSPFLLSVHGCSRCVCLCVCVASRQVTCGSFLHFLSLSFPHSTLFSLSLALSSLIVWCVLFFFCLQDDGVKKKEKKKVLKAAFLFIYLLYSLVFVIRDNNPR